MGGLCTASVSPTVSHSSVLSNTSIPEWTSQGGQTLFENAKNLASRPYQTYGQPRLADFTPDEQNAWSSTRANQGAWNPTFNSALDFTKDAAGQWTDPGVASSYMNPFLSNVQGVAANQLNRQFDMQRNDAISRAVMQDAFGGDRATLLEAENERNRNQALSDMYANTSYQAYDAGNAAFENDRRRALSAGGQLGTLANNQSDLLARDAAGLEAIGKTQRASNQAGLDLAYNDFQNQQLFPYQQLNFAIGALKGVPYEQSTLTNASQEQLFQNPSLLGQGLGALGALYAGYNLLNPSKTST